MTMTKSAERQVIRKAKQGDGIAIEQLIRAHQNALYAFMLRMCGRPDVAEDVVQEAFVRVLRNLDRFDTRFRFSTWLFTIAKRLYMNQVQKHSPSFESDLVDMHQGAGDRPEDGLEQAEVLRNARSAIDEALKGLNELQREIVLLFHQQNWPISEIAVYLDMPEGTIKSHLHRARKRMRRIILSSSVTERHVEEVWS
ncbi:MAG: RNA polymerase sigma factor [Phycisphaeraceae bacterium]|nr:MAG: RNA polymerase sigma factor [Phycisphaeraceae bacterium]